MFVDFEPVWIFENRSGVSAHGSDDNSMSKKEVL